MPKQQQQSALTVRYALLTTQKTRHVVGPPQESLVVPASLEAYAFPLLSIWPPECGFAGIRQRLMFVYAEYAESTRGNLFTGRRPTGCKVRESRSIRARSR
jgi:hypothetical protein